jgi:hypothetical protein
MPKNRATKIWQQLHAHNPRRLARRHPRNRRRNRRRDATSPATGATIHHPGCHGFPDTLCSRRTASGGGDAASFRSNPSIVSPNARSKSTPYASANTSTLHRQSANSCASFASSSGGPARRPSLAITSFINAPTSPTNPCASSARDHGAPLRAVSSMAKRARTATARRVNSASSITGN